MQWSGTQVKSGASGFRLQSSRSQEQAVAHRKRSNNKLLQNPDCTHHACELFLTHPSSHLARAPPGSAFKPLGRMFSLRGWRDGGGLSGGVGNLRRFLLAKDKKHKNKDKDK